MQMSQSQVDAIGGVEKCTFSPPPNNVTPPPDVGPSVQVVDPDKPGFIVIELLNARRRPVAGAKYSVKLPNGKIVTGKLDGKGKVRIEGIDPGECVIRFPDFDTPDTTSVATTDPAPSP
ncbi:MAG: hypothetical protein ABI647_26485 [Gemmatimonadota bacterium]